MHPNPDGCNPIVRVAIPYGMSILHSMQGNDRRSFPPPPTEARVLILRAHPSLDSFNTALASNYQRGAESVGLRVDSVDTDSLEFDLRLRGPTFGSQPLEPALATLQAKLAKAAHLVVASPVWWGSVPASFKGLIDRTFLPGWAYRTGDTAFPERGLKGRSSRVLLTMDAPAWWDRLKYARSASRQLEDAWLAFIGISSLGVTRFSSIEKSNVESRSRMLNKAELLGRRDGVKVAARFRRADQAAPTHVVTNSLPSE